MSIEVLNRIREAERAGEELVSGAKSRALAAIAMAEEESERVLERARESAEAEARQIADSVIAAARLEADSVQKKAESGGEESVARAEARMRPAVDLIVERVVKGHGRS